MRKRSQHFFILLTVAISSFLTPYTSASVNIALPHVADQLSATSHEIGWIQTSYLLAAAMSLLPFARFADITSRKRIFGMGVLIFTVAACVCAFAPIISVLIVARFLQGIGGAMITGTAVAILSASVPPEKRGKAIGVNTAAIYIGLTSGPLLGGTLTQYFGWRSIFISTILFGIFALVLIATKLGEQPSHSKEEHFDLLGSGIYAVMVFLGIYAASSYPSPYSIPLFGATLGFLFLFIVREQHIDTPIIDLGLFKEKMFALSNLTAHFNYLATFAISFLLNLYLQYIKHLPSSVVGMVLLARPSVMALFSPLAGWISDKTEPRIIASLGLAIITGTLYLFSQLSVETSLLFIIGNLTTLGLGFALFSSPNTNAVMSSVKQQFYGVASATVGTMRLLGQSLSMVLTLFVFSITPGTTNPPFEPSSLLTATSLAFQLFSILCFLSVITSLLRGNLKEEAPH